MPVERREGGVVGVVPIAVDFVILTTVHEIYAHMLTRTHAHVHACAHAGIPTYMHARLHACTQVERM